MDEWSLKKRQEDRTKKPHIQEFSRPWQDKICALGLNSPGDTSSDESSCKSKIYHTVQTPRRRKSKPSTAEELSFCVSRRQDPGKKHVLVCTGFGAH